MGMDTAELSALTTDEVVTHSYVRDVTMPSGTTMALLTLDNGRDHTRPNTLGPATLIELSGVLDELAARAGRGEIAAVGITGKPYILAAGADLSKIGEIPSREIARQMAQLGHETFGKLTELGVPSFVFINGLALGGGLEVAPECQLPHDRQLRARDRPARGVPRTHPGLGRYLAVAEPDRDRERPQGGHRESAEEQPDAQGPARRSSSASPMRCSRRSPSSRTRSGGPTAW